MTIKTFQRLLCFMTATPDFGLALEVFKKSYLYSFNEMTKLKIACMQKTRVLLLLILRSIKSKLIL